MTQKKSNKKQASVLSAAAEADSDERPDPVALVVETRFSFPTVSACPRCRGTQTRATSTQGRIQFRRCQAPICRFKFSIRGKPV